MIRDLFASNISRQIEEIIKVDQADEEVIRGEIDEYVVTDAIGKYYTEILDRYLEAPNKRPEGVGIWISGFFGSGKSSFAKMLGLAIENHLVMGDQASLLFGQKTGSQKIQVLLKNITERIPTEAVIFDVSTDRGIRSGNQSITEIMYRVFLQRLGYARDLDLSELEITLEGEGRLEAFEQSFATLFDGKDWNKEKGKIAIAIQQASRVMHELDPDTFPTADSWRASAQDRADITPGILAERCRELMSRRHPGKNLLFVIDEVGQFVARDLQKMLDLQAVIKDLGRVGRGTMWLAVTSQEKLTELVGGLDDKRVELARLMDRFPLQVHLEPSDISEVTSKRVLSKNAAAQVSLRELFSQHRGRLTDNTRMTADIRLPELSADGFIDLYPLMPYQVDLIIQVVSGLRMQGGASKHVGGANRTIIKLAQQLLIHPDTKLADREVGALAAINQIYDLVSGNISSEIRGKIDAIAKEVAHPLAQSVAKAICLLQYVRSIHRTAENIAASLHPAVDAGSRLAEVKEALTALEKAHQVRLGDDGYRIPTPSEDDWERQRSSLNPKPGDANRIYAEVVSGLWSPQPAHMFLNTKRFTAGLFFNGRPSVEGDIPVHLYLVDAAKEFQDRVNELRTRSQSETRSIFWCAAINGAIDRQMVELFRSREILSRKERSAQTKDEAHLVAEEKVRLQKHLGELRLLIKQACLNGSIFFRGNDRSPDDTASDVGRTAGVVLGEALPEVFDRFEEAAGHVQKKDLDVLLTTENLRGLTPIFTDLGLVREENGKVVFKVDAGPLAEVYARIENRHSYGEAANGKYLSTEFAKEPFGWEFDVIRLLVLCLLRAGKIEATSKGDVIETALSLEARNTFSNNNLFKQASFRPKVGVDFPQLVEAVKAFADVFGRDIPEIEQKAVANAVRAAMGEKEETVREVHTTMMSHGLPGADILQECLDQMRAIRSGKEEHVILTFNGAYREIKEAIKRAAELSSALTDQHLGILRNAKKACLEFWPFLQDEIGLDDSFRDSAEQLKDLLARETFFRSFPDIERYAKVLADEYHRRHAEAAAACSATYQEAVERLKSTPGYEQLEEEKQEYVCKPLKKYVTGAAADGAPIAQLRTDLEACNSRLSNAVEEMMRIVDGERVVKLEAAKFFQGGIDSEEQLDAALIGLRDECERLLGAGKKVLIQ